MAHIQQMNVVSLDELIQIELQPTIDRSVKNFMLVLKHKLGKNSKTKPKLAHSIFLPVASGCMIFA